MVDVNTIIGEPIYIDRSITIIPVSKVSFGFVAGGSEFNSETIEEYKKKDKDEEIVYKNPFGGGSGAGVNITPMTFLIINNGNIKLMPLEYSSTLDKIIDYIPDIINKAKDMMDDKKEKGVKENKEDNLDNNSEEEKTFTYTFTEENTDEDE